MNPKLRLSCLMQPEQNNDVGKLLDSFKPFCPALINLNRAAAHPSDWLKYNPLPHGAPRDKLVVPFSTPPSGATSLPAPPARQAGRSRKQYIASFTHNHS